MTRKLIAGLVLAALLPIPVWAQGETRTKPSWVLCGDDPTEVPYTLEEWQQMYEWQRRNACTTQGKSSVSRSAAVAEAHADLVKMGLRPDPTKKPYNTTLGVVGTLMGLAGGLMLLPKGDTVHVLGDDFCVNTNRVDYGDCGPGLKTAQVGLVLLGSGIALGWLGFHQVDIHPLVAPGTKGAKATVSWGGKGK